MTKVLSIINQKGGLGKTTVTLNLADTFTTILNKKKEDRVKVLLIDNDPQGSLSSVFYDVENQLEEDQTLIRIYDIKPEFSSNCILKTKNENLFIVPNFFFTNKFEMSLLQSINGRMRLKKFIESICGDFEYVFIDNSPSLGVFTANALIASDFLIIPTELSNYSIKGLRDVIDTFVEAKEANSNLELAGILINKFEKMSKDSSFLKDKLYKTYGENVFTTLIHKAEDLKKAENRNRSIGEYKKNSRAYREFRLLALEILSKINKDNSLFDEKSFYENAETDEE